MSKMELLSDLELAALVASRICHDALGPMTSIGFGMEMLEEDEDEEDRAMGLNMIRKGVGSVMAKIQFARLAFGAGGSAGTSIELAEIKKIAGDYVEGDGKYKIDWGNEPDSLPRDPARLLLNLIAIAISAIPRGGEIAITFGGRPECPDFLLRLKGAKARVPDRLEALLEARPGTEIDARSVQAYYCGRLSRSLDLHPAIYMEGDDVVLEALANSA